MDLDDLTAALAAPKPDRRAVLDSFRRKQRRRKARLRLCLAGAVAACAAVAAALVTVGQPRAHDLVAPSPRGCTQAALTRSLAGVRQAGASILLATESPAGRAARAGFTAVVLTSVRTLSGPVISSGTVAWTDGTAIGGAAGPAQPGAGTTSGRVLAIVWPAALAGSPAGLVLRAAPVVGGNVILTASACTDAAAMPPGSAPTGGAAPEASYAVPLRTVENAAASLAGDSQGREPQPSPGPTPGAHGGQSPGSGASSAGNEDRRSGDTQDSAAPDDSPASATPGDAASSGASQSGGSSSSSSGSGSSSSGSGGSGGNSGSGSGSGSGGGSGGGGSGGGGSGGGGSGGGGSGGGGH